MKTLTSLKNRIEELEKASSGLTEKQKHNITLELKVADNILKRMLLLCKVINKNTQYR